MQKACQLKIIGNWQDLVQIPWKIMLIDTFVASCYSLVLLPAGYCLNRYH